MPVGGNFTTCNCGPDTAACENPTQPIATVGLCLADGTPIATTVVRDCAGNVTQEGWLNLTTGAWTTGAPPAGVVACGDSRSIQVSGVFCDVNPDTDEVLGLVLVEYSYAADGSIDSVRLVDAVTGTTYTPQGEITTCPAGVEQPERDLVQLCDVLTDPDTGETVSTPFVRDYARDENGQITGHTDYTLDGQPYTPAGTVTVCQPEPEKPCAQVTVLRLCDLNPDVQPNADGKRCATPFLRHLVYDCTGALVETHDTTMDGTTPYTPVEAVDCGSGGTPAMVEVPWEVVGIEQDPDSAEGRGFIFTLSPIDDPDTVGTITVTTTSTANTQCPGTPPQYVFRNPCTYTFTPDQALQDAATYVRCDLIDFDTFEPVTNLNPPPDRLGGTAYWDGTTVRPTESNGTGEMYYDGPPAQWSYRVGNTGGGNSCTQLSFAAVSLRPEGCCADCGGSGGGDGGRTVQEVCVIATAAPDDVMRWTRVIEDGGATIYYLDQNGARYDNTLPAGHQIVACPEQEPAEPCRDSASTLLCDVASLDTVTVLDTVNVQNADGWEVTSFTDGGCGAINAPDGPVPGPAVWASGSLGVRADMSLGTGCEPWTGYDTAPVRWVLTKTFTAPEDGTAVVTADSFLADGGARVRINGQDVGLYTQWNQPAVGGSSQVPVTAGPNVIEIEVRDASGPNWLRGRLDIVMTRTTQFMRRTVVDCETGETVSVTDTTLDGEPYEVTGEVGQCEPVADCCPPPPPETRVDIEAVPLCVRDTESGDVLARVVAERVYDDQSGELVEQRLTTADGAPYTLPAGAELVDCGEIEEPCRDTNTLLLCDSEIAPRTSTPDVTDTDKTDLALIPSQTATPLLPGGGQTLWDGGTLTFPADPNGAPGGGAQVYRTVAGQITDDVPPECTNATATVTASLRVRNNGPNPGDNWCGALMLFRNGQVIDRHDVTLGAPVGHQETLTVTGEVPAADLMSGAVKIALELETFHGNGPKGWTADQFTVGVVYPGCSVQFLRTVTTDCETGAVVATTDTTLDGQPYTVTGEVGQCQAAGGGECCPPPPPETRLDVETHLLCVRDTESGDTIAQVLVERVYDDQTGDLAEQRLTTLDGAPYTLPDEHEIAACPGQEPEPCRTTTSMLVCDLNTSLEPGDTTVQDHNQQLVDWPGWAPLPGGGSAFWSGGSLVFPSEPNGSAGNGSEVHRWITGRITSPAPVCDDGTGTATVTVAFDARVDGPANACGAFGSARILTGDGTSYTTAGQGFGHANEPAFTVGTTIPVTLTAVVPSAELAAGNIYVWLNLRTYRQSQAGWDNCFSGAEGPISWTVSNFTLDIEQQFGDDCATQFIRNVTVDCDGNVVAISDTTLDGQPYTPVGEVGQCQTTGGECCETLQTLTLCDVTENGTTPFLRHFTYAPGSALPAVRDTGLDGATPYEVTGTVGVCPVEQEPCAVQSVLEACRYDDTDGDGIPDVSYVELIGVDCEGTLTSLGTYTEGLTEPYTPVNPVDPDDQDEGAPAPTLVEVHRIQLDAGQTWDASTVTLLQSVTATAHGGNAQITTAGGTTTLFDGESVTWSVIRPDDAALTGPLTITAGPGVVTVSYTRTTVS